MIAQGRNTTEENQVGIFFKIPEGNLMEARVHTMDQKSTLRPIARNIFNTNDAKYFQSVSLDEILDMLVRYEGAEDTEDFDPNKKLIDE